MRIALLNNRYFMVGGTTRYLFNVEALLREAGHTVVPFSNRYAQTVETPYSAHFVDPPGDPNAPFYRQARLSLRAKWSLFVRGAYSHSVKRAFGRVLDEHDIDLAFSVNICNFLGPSVIDAARERGIPYVARLSDFNLLCPSYNFLREGKACEECTTNLMAAVKHRCLQNSTAVSLARVTAMALHRTIGVYDRVSAMVTPTSFLRGKLVQGGFAAERIHHVPTFVDLARFRPRADAPNDEIVYAGRLAVEKGVDTVIEAMGRIPAERSPRLVLLGEGDAAYTEALRRRAEAVAPGRVEFAGFLDREALIERVGRALALVMPARWYENMPNAVTEAMALARPVLASDLGSLPEQVVDGETGLLLPVDDAVAWADAIGRLHADRALAARLGRAGRDRAENEYTPEKHYERLMAVFGRAGVRTAVEAPEA